MIIFDSSTYDYLGDRSWILNAGRGHSRNHDSSKPSYAEALLTVAIVSTAGQLP